MSSAATRGYDPPAHAIAYYWRGYNRLSDIARYLGSYSAPVLPHNFAMTKQLVNILALLMLSLLWSTIVAASTADMVIDECAEDDCFEPNVAHALDVPDNQVVLEHAIQPTATISESNIYANSTAGTALATPTYSILCVRTGPSRPGFANVCENWCYYVFCHKGGKDKNSDYWTVTVNRKANKRNSSECGRKPTKCSTKRGIWPPNPVSGQDCDEQPKNTNDEGGADAATRCIPLAENRGEGSAWSAFINSRSAYIADGTKIRVELQRPTGPICASYRKRGTTVCPAPAQPSSAARDGVRQQ